MGCNTSQAILSNLQVSDSTADLPRNNPNHDKLFKICPFVDMIDRTFLQSYKPGRDISVDENCCPYKGRVLFKCYNPSRPSKWHLKLFKVSDAKTGYIVAFEVYCGKNRTRIVMDANVLDPECTTTTKTVMGLLKKGNLLGKGHHVYMDNYYSSPEFFWELHFKETLACGTCRSNRKKMPESVTKTKLKKKGECVFRRNGPLLCLKWKEKKDVTMLSTVHEAIFMETGDLDREGKKIGKPECSYYYCGRMGGVDLSDQLLNYYSFLRKSMKWSQKWLIHLFNLVILNAYIINRHHGCQKLNHDEFRDHLVKYLLQERLKSYKIPLLPVLSSKVKNIMSKIIMKNY